MNDEYINTFDSAKNAGISIGIKYFGDITNCCRKKIKSSRGYKWFYANDPDQPDKSRITAD